jgi:hypothetical protein
MAALQGGCLLARTVRDTTPMKVVLDTAIDHVRGYVGELGEIDEPAEAPVPVPACAAPDLGRSAAHDFRQAGRSRHRTTRQ